MLALCNKSQSNQSMKAISKIFFFLLVLAACGKKDEPQSSAPNGSAAESFTATLHDTSFTADYFVNTFPGPNLQLNAFETSSQRSVTLSLDNNTVGQHTMSNGFIVTCGSCQGGGGAGYYSIHGAGHGIINVTNSSSTEISGNFSFTAYNTAGTDSAVVTGQFSHLTF